MKIMTLYKSYIDAGNYSIPDSNEQDHFFCLLPVNDLSKDQQVKNKLGGSPDAV
jgi:hypothetical protein